MINLETIYMGLKLRNPLIVGSSGLTNSLENIIEIAQEGAGAVVLKSLFEEQINTENITEYSSYYSKNQKYINNYTTSDNVLYYLNLIKECKDNTDIPIIASLNCISDRGWIDFAKKIEDAGADALELNVFVLPSNIKKNSAYNEKIYFDIINKVQNAVNIPIALKLGYYFSALAHTMEKLSHTGVKSLVLFNRFFLPDIDIDKFELKSSNVFSSPSDIALSLQWVAMLSNRIDCNIVASTGIHSGEAIIKQLLVGATAVQIASVLYKKGIKEISIMLKKIKAWMEENNFNAIVDFRGKMSVDKLIDLDAFERIQFMKYFSGIE